MLVFGWAGGIVNCIHVFPQMIKIYTTKSVEDISSHSILIKLAAAVLYIIHGYIIWDMPLLVMTLIVAVQYAFILMQYKYYSQLPKCTANTAESTETIIPQTSIVTENRA